MGPPGDKEKEVDVLAFISKGYIIQGGLSNLGNIHIQESQWFPFTSSLLYFHGIVAVGSGNGRTILLKRTSRQRAAWTLILRWSFPAPYPSTPDSSPSWLTWSARCSV